MSNIVVLDVPHYIWFLLAMYLVCVTLLRLAAVAEWIHDICTPQKQNSSYLTHVSTDHPEKMQAYHSDCGTKMENGRCPQCNIDVDMQSIELRPVS